MRSFRLAGSLVAAFSFLATTVVARAGFEHVLLISVDGLHATDLSRYVAKHPQSTLAAWSAQGLTYTKAMTTMPSDSFPGLLSMITGGSPRSTGVWYDDAFGHDLANAKDCVAGRAAKGAEYDYSEAIDVENKSMFTTIDVSKLVVDPMKGCQPVYPHSLVRTNNIFEIVVAAGRTTAWADKHPAYDLVQGPSGSGVGDLFVPEITVPHGDDAAASVEATIAYDAIKVKAVVNELRGLDHTGEKKTAVPAVLGMNFQAVSVGQKLKGVGYLNAEGEPSPGLATELDAVDASLGSIKAALESEKLGDRTLVIVTAKHGQSPIDPAKRRIVDSKALKEAINSVGKEAIAGVTTDDVALIWLADKSKTNDVVGALEARRADLAIDKIVSGAELVANFGDPAKDPRVPDIIVQPVAGVIYTKPTATKIAEHGGGTQEDRNVALLISNPSFSPARVDQDVATTQIAPTILQVLGLDPEKLDAVKLEKTAILPALPASATGR